MKAKRFGRTRAVGHGSVIALLTAALVFFGVTRVVNRPDTRLGKVLLTAVNDFSISSTISSSSATRPRREPVPGTDRYFWYTVSNPLHAPITVTAMSIPSGGVTAPAGCAASNLDLTHTTFSGSLVVPAKVGVDERHGECRGRRHQALERRESKIPAGPRRSTSPTRGPAHTPRSTAPRPR